MIFQSKLYPLVSIDRLMDCLFVFFLIAFRIEFGFMMFSADRIDIQLLFSVCFLRSVKFRSKNFQFFVELSVCLIRVFG